MPFVFGETPAQAARMGYDIAQQNRQAITRANELEADYAFRTNQMENAAAQNMAAIARAQQQEQNQLARESFMFGEQAKRQARADAMAKLQFDTQRKDIERQFAFDEKQLKADELEAAAEAENTGTSLAEALSRLTPAAKEARRARDEAAAAEAFIINNARRIGYGYDEVKKKIVGEGQYRTAEDYNRELGEARMNLKAAKEALAPIENELSIAERQARQFRFAVLPDAVKDISRGKTYSFGPVAPTSGPASPPPAVSPAPSPMPGVTAAPAGGRYIPGRVYGGKRYLGGPPTDRTSWQTVTN